MAMIVEYVEILSAFVFFLFISRLILNKTCGYKPLPVVGMLPELLCNAWRVHDFAAKVLQKHAQTFVFKGPWFLNMDFVITSDPMNVQHIFTRNFNNYPKGHEFKQILEPLGDGIFNSDGELWKFQRKMIQTLMNNKSFEFTLEKTTRDKVQKGLFTILEHASEFGMEVDMQDVFQRFTFDNFCLLALGYDPNCLTVEFPKVSYEKAYDYMEEAMLYRHILPESVWKLQRWLQIGREKKFAKACQIFDQFLYKCISLKREKLNTRKTCMEEEEFDFLTSLLIKQEEEKEGEMGALVNSDKFLKDATFNLLIAGRDAISSTLVWLLWFVATHPSVEKKILDEIRVNLPKSENEQLRNLNSKLVYLHAAICETLRLYPPIPYEHKRSIDPDILPSGHHIGANTRILFSFYAMGRSKEIWGKDCLEFKPERWISERGGIVHVPSYKFMAFISGPRTCLGKDMAFTQVKIIASFIIWNYHVHVVEDHPVTPSLSILLNMRHGLKVRVSKRHG